MVRYSVVSVPALPSEQKRAKGHGLHGYFRNSLALKMAGSGGGTLR